MTENKLNKEIEMFIDEMKKFFSDELISIIVYGSYAKGDFLKGFSDINILVLVKEFSADDMENFAGIFSKKFSSGQLKPVIFTPSIIKNSWDIFPFQWYEIKKYGLVVYGKDFRDEIVISKNAIREQLKREARQFYFSLQSLLMTKDYINLVETVFKQAKIIKTGLEYLNIRKVEFGYLENFENIIKNRFNLFRKLKLMKKIVNEHIKTLEKTVLVLDSEETFY